MSATPEHKRLFVAAARSAPMMFGEIARATGLPMEAVLNVWAVGSQAGKLRIADDVPGFRRIEVLP